VPETFGLLAINPAQRIKEIVRLAVSIACRLQFLKVSESSDLKAQVLMEARYGGERNQKIVRAKPHATRNLIDLAVENNHLSIKGLERAQTKVAMLQKSR
jgi:hypothetical protein